jgi:putative hydrolase of the HAD superfamily
MLSSIETAIALSGGEIRAAELQQVMDLGREMLEHPVELLDGVPETVAELAPRHRVLLITKGDLRDQERKLQKSGLAVYFSAVEIVSEKNETTYAAILRRHGIEARQFLMVGNSLKSDIQPVLALGGLGAYIPYHLTWAAEHVEEVPDAPGRFFTLGSVRHLPTLVETWAASIRELGDRE